MSRREVPAVVESLNFVVQSKSPRSRSCLPSSSGHQFLFWLLAGCHWMLVLLYLPALQVARERALPKAKQVWVPRGFRNLRRRLQRQERVCFLSPHFSRDDGKRLSPRTTCKPQQSSLFLPQWRNPLGAIGAESSKPLEMGAQLHPGRYHRTPSAKTTKLTAADRGAGGAMAPFPKRGPSVDASRNCLGILCPFSGASLLQPWPSRSLPLVCPSSRTSKANPVMGAQPAT